MSKTTHDDAPRIITALDLKPHPEGGHFRETHRAPSPPGARSPSTAIYFLLPASEFSAFHLLRSAVEIWHHYAGDPLELHTLAPDGAHAMTVLGPDIEAGQRPQAIVPPGTLQAAVVRGSRYALCGCTVAPGFEFDDFAMPARDELLARFPQHAALIGKLTR